MQVLKLKQKKLLLNRYIRETWKVKCEKTITKVDISIILLRLLLCKELFTSHFSRFTSLKMFHVKHRFLRFSVFGDQWEAICFPAFRKSLSFFTSLIFKIIIFSILSLIFSVFSTFFLYFRVFHVVFRLCFLSFIKLFNYIFIFSYELNFYIRFFGFSKPFTKRILGPFFHGFLPIWKDFIP